MDYLTRGYQRYIEMVCEFGGVRADLFSNKVILTDERGEIEEKNFQNYLWNDMYVNMLSDFINCIKRNKSSSISLQDGLISNRIAIDIRNEFYAKA